jgi:hypothetical protein
MRIDTHVARGATQALSLAVRDVLFGLWVPVLFGHAEIDHMHHRGSLCARPTDEEVVRLDITINKVLFVNGLHSVELEITKLKWIDNR